MAAYKKIQGNPIKPKGGRPSGDYGNQVTHHVPDGISIKGSNGGIARKSEPFIAKSASGHVSVRGGQRV